MKRPNRKHYDLNDIFECVKCIKDNESYIDYLEMREKKFTSQDKPIKPHIDDEDTKIPFKATKEGKLYIETSDFFKQKNVIDVINKLIESSLYKNIKNNNDLSDLQKMDVAEAVDIEMKRFKDKLLLNIETLIRIEKDSINANKPSLLTHINMGRLLAFDDVKKIINEYKK